MSTEPRDTEEYRCWWKANAPVPYGYCWCGCGEKTKLAKQSSTVRGQVKGEPVQYLPYHHLKPKLIAEQEADICERYRRGEGGDVIGARHGVSANTVYEALERNGVERRPSTALNQLPEPRQDEVCERYESGESTVALAEAFGVSNVTVSNILRRRGIEARKSKLTASDQDQICQRYRAGENTVELAERYGVSSSAVARVLHRNRVPIQNYGVTDEQAAEICRLYEAGGKMPAICKKVGVGRAAAHAALVRTGVELRKGNRAFTDVQEAEIVRRTEAGEEVRDIADSFGRSVSPIYNVLWRHRVRLGFSSVDKQLTKEQKDRICEMYRSGVAPKNISPEFGMSEMGVKGVLRARGVPVRSYSEAAKVASRPEDEAALRDRLAERLESDGAKVRTEAPMLAGGKCDILAEDQNGSRLLIEVKIGKPLHGIGQLFGYRVGLEPSPEMVLAVSEAWWRKSPGSSATFLRRACEEAGVALWVVAENGTLAAPSKITANP